jgi:20S proteasome subunit beta 2
MNVRILLAALAILTDSTLSESYPHSSQTHPLLVSRNSDSLEAVKRGRARIASHDSIAYQEEHRIISSLNSELDVSSEESFTDLLRHFPQSLALSSSSSSLEDKPNHGMMHILDDGFQSGNEIQLTINAIDPRALLENNPLTSKQNHKYLKTGTTIVGVQTREGIILAADTRATEGSIVADTRCEKVHQLSRNVWCCGAGTSGDLDALTRKVRYTFLLKDMIRDSVGNDGLRRVMNGNGDDYSNEQLDFQSEEETDINQSLGEASISSICHMIREDLTKGGGQIGANLVLGGVDPFTQQPVLTAIHPHGSIDVIPYTALGSGGLAAMGVLEARYHVDMTMEEGVELVKEAVLAGIKNDLGSGSQVSSCVPLV